MDRSFWAGTCKECHFTKVAPDRAEAIFALEKHVRFTGHLAWDVVRVTEAPGAGAAEGTAAYRIHRIA